MGQNPVFGPRWSVTSLLRLLLALMAVGVAVRADSHKLPPPAQQEIDFLRDVDPILQKHCYACHGPQMEMNGFSLWRKKDALRGGYSGRPAIVAGHSAKSRLIHLVTGLEEDLMMPPSGSQLATQEIALLRAWIDQGVPWARRASEERDKTETPWLDMDYGPFVSASISVGKPEDPRADKEPGDNTTYKGIGIALTADKRASVVFDTELLRYSAGWTGDPLVLTGTVFDWKHGPHPYIAGQPIFENPVAPGWARDGSFSDPRTEEFGRLPDDWGKYRGLYVHGEKVVLSYSVGETGVLEIPGLRESESLAVLTRAFEIEPSQKQLLLQVAAIDGSAAETVSVETLQPASGSAAMTLARFPGEEALVAGVAGISSLARWQLSEKGHIRLRVPASETAQRFTLSLARVPEERLGAFARVMQERPTPGSLSSYTRGGPSRFIQKVQTQGKLGQGSGAYLIDELTLPFKNPWKSWFRPGDFAFFSDDRAAVTTWSGDVWIVSGIDVDLSMLTWKRYATGLYQPLGVEVVDDEVYVLGRDQITRLHDLNADGEADFYENFNNDFLLTHHFHEFTFDLETDRAGNFYFAKAARHALPAKTKHHGTILKLDPKGKNLEILCSGFRVPNGVAVGPRGEITTSDQEGHWIPSTRINWCSPGSFHGYMWSGVVPNGRTDYDNPITFLPITVDNSGAGQAFVESDRWGPFRGHLVHSSFGRGKIFLIPMERVNGQIQGGAVEFPLRFDTGLMRPHFRKQDGQLYLSGLYGWGTSRKAPGGFYRVRYTGKPVYMLKELHVTSEGVWLTFTSALDPATANDARNYYASRWNYKWTSRYGSDRFTSGGEPGTEQVEIISAELQQDGKTVLLKMAYLREVMQMQVGFKIRAADGAAIDQVIVHTINTVSPDKGKAVVAEF